VLLLHGCDASEAMGVLDRAGGQLRAALALIGKPGPQAADLRHPARLESPALYDDLVDE
jgi:hypothetical protein